MEAARKWAVAVKAAHPEVIRIGFFGSYTRGDYVPGSDFDVLIEVTSTSEGRRADRAARYLPQSFPVGMELFVYTSEELARLQQEGSSFLRAIEAEFVLL